MTPILASEPITVKRIIFRIQSKNFSKLQFTLSHSLSSSPQYISAQLELHSRRKITIKYMSKIAQAAPPFSSLLSIFKSELYGPFCDWNWNKSAIDLSKVKLRCRSLSIRRR